VLDLDETLIHYMEVPTDGLSEGGHFLIRPGARQFLKDMAECYEIVIFTAAMQDYADWVLDALDTGKAISHRLYR
jgi:CTD small phosphatase-like protein 2